MMFKNLNHFTIIRTRASFTFATSPTNSLFYFFLQRHSFSSSSSSSSVGSIEKSSNQSSFTFNYLINSCGFTPNKALSASKYIKLEGRDKPNSVITFFKDHGFTPTQISKLVNYFPMVLTRSPQKIFLPKLEFLKSKGLSDSDIALILCEWPQILTRSLENQLIPSFNFFSNMLLSYQRENIVIFKRCVGVLLFDLKKHGTENVEMLKKAGVPLKNIGYFLSRHPRTFMTKCDKFRQIVDEVTKMGFNPTQTTFMKAVLALRSMTKSTWDRKVDVYKKWGWSEKEIDVAFRYNPTTMSLSENNINSVMEFWVNRMGWESSFLVSNPTIIQMSLKKRIVPRCEIYRALLSKGVKKPCGLTLSTALTITENCFLQKITKCHGEEAPELLKLYNEKIKLANN